MTAAAVAAAGLVAFVGLVTPHVLRLLIGPDQRRLLWASALYGALFVVLADLAARTLLSPTEVPLGVITGIVGGTVLPAAAAAGAGALCLLAPHPFAAWTLARSRQRCRRTRRRWR